MGYDIENEWRDAELSTGTTIIGMEYDEGVIIAADSRTSTGSYVANRVTDKLTKITDYVYCCRSGSAADTQAIADIVSYNMYLSENATGKPANVQDVAKEFKQICYNYRSQLTAGIIVAGYDNTEKKGKIYSIPLGGMIFQEPYTIGGSGSSYIYGFMESRFKPDMNKNDAVKLACEAVGQAMTHDGSSGGVIRVALISKTGKPERFVFTQTLLHQDLGLQPTIARLH
jgi:20S proteasome subunit beta 1